jgi:hypothetical protein
LFWFLFEQVAEQLLPQNITQKNLFNAALKVKFPQPEL